MLFRHSYLKDVTNTLVPILCRYLVYVMDSKYRTFQTEDQESIANETPACFRSLRTKGESSLH